MARNKFAFPARRYWKTKLRVPHYDSGPHLLNGQLRESGPLGRRQTRPYLDDAEQHVIEFVLVDFGAGVGNQFVDTAAAAQSHPL